MSSLNAKRRKGVLGWYDRLSQFNIEALFVRPPPPGPPRTIFVNEPLPEDYYDPKKPHKVKKEYRYSANQVITSKYTLLTFLPRNLLEQFRRVANIFFLAIAILQFFNKFSTISPGLVILPLLIVWGITALKDGYEDFKRHQSDRRVNYSPIRILAGGGWSNPNAMTAKARTFVRALTRFRRPRLTKKAKVGRRGANPDVEMLEHAAPPEAIASETTDQPIAEPIPFAEYDDADDAESTGEHGMPMFHHHRGPSRPHWSRGIWEDLKVGDILKIVDGESIPADMLICATSEDENVAFVETKNLDGETNLKSRTAVPALTHMRTAAACANPKNAFTIEADRPELLMHKLNAAVVVNGERSAVDLNQVLLRGTVLKNTEWVIAIVMYTGYDTKLVLNAGGTPSKRGRVERQMDPMVFANLIILAIMAVVCAIVDSVLEQRYFPRGAPWLFNDNRSDDNPHINGLVTWAFALITFQNIVPISLYISIEVVRTAQAAFIYFDREMFYEKTGTATVARSFVLSDDLGQIEYIFSDKTGTLTQNAMVFRRASIGSQIFVGNEEDEDDIDPSKSVKSLKDDMMPSSASTSASPSPRQPHETVLRPMDASRVKLSGGVLQHFRCAPLTAEINAAASNPDSADRHRIGMFWTTLALCHTVLAGVDPETGDLEYKAQSPDEAALVQAAADIGFEFRGRDRDVLYVRTPFATEQLRFRLLTILDFTSARKRMSVLVRALDADEREVGPVLLLSKGADSVIFERLAPGREELKATTEAQLDEFASSGLRTLTLGFREVPQAEYDAWSAEYKVATASIEDREDMVERVSNKIEQGLTLLGATAIEDRLQDGVPEAIADLKRAGIKIWVLTGDKLETAIAIGHSTNLISPDSNIIIIRGKTGENPDGRTIYRQMLRAVEEYFPQSGILDDPLVVVEDLGMAERPSQSFPMRRMSSDVRSLVGEQNGQRPGGYVLVIDGLALEDALGDEKHKHLLLKLGTMCQGVVCCRVSPKQKALVVRLVKDGLNTMTLAIGDGANDVSMIQAADVGVGISGEEGLQAVNSSDYAIAQFRYLKRLLLVHGHWSYARNGNMITNFFYKNIICIGVLWWFQIYCGWSSAYVFEYTYLLWWNSFWTLAPVIGIGLFDRILDDHVLMAIPELYRYGREQKWFGNKLFAVYMFDGIVQSAIVFFPILYTYNSISGRSDGYQVGQYEFATVMAIAAVLTANLFNGLNTNVWTGWVFFAVFLGIVLIWAYTAIYSLISPGWFYTPVFGNDWFLFRSPLFWFSLPITVLISLLPRYIYKAIKYGFFPDDVDILRWNYKMNPQLDFEHDVRLRSRSDVDLDFAASERMMPPAPTTSPYRAQTHQTTTAMGSQIDMATGVRSQSRGYGFAAEEQGVEMRRIQSHLSSTTNLPRRASRGSRVLQTIRKPLRRKRPTDLAEE